MADPHFKTGARMTPRHKLLAAIPHIVIEAPPTQYAVVPARLSVWDNDVDGDCVTAEEAFAKACYSPEIFIPDSEVIAWARAHGVLNGAGLTQVMDMMQGDGFVIGGQKYDDGPYSGVDYSNELVLQSAISQGPVKLGMAASCLPSTAGRMQGWFSTGPQHNGGEDHCTGLSGYGPAGYLYEQLKVNVPSTLHPDQHGYLLFTWGSIGFVDHPWLMAALAEAWLRSPTTVGVPPLGPNPTPPPTPPPVPGGVAFVFNLPSNQRPNQRWCRLSHDPTTGQPIATAIGRYACYLAPNAPPAAPDLTLGFGQFVPAGRTWCARKKVQVLKGTYSAYLMAGALLATDDLVEVLAEGKRGSNP